MRALSMAKWAVPLLVAILSGCASVPPPEPLGDRERVLRWQERQLELATIDSWSLRGKMGVKTGPKGGSATLKWDFGGTVERIELYGPFGGGRVIIKVDADGAVLRDTKGNTIVGNTASEVLYQRLGWQVPFDHMASWARGLPSPGATEIKIDDQGQLQSLVEGNWSVNYQGYKTIPGTGIENLKLPSRLTVAARPGTMEIYSDEGEYLGDELRVKVIFKRWWEVAATEPVVDQTLIQSTAAE